MGDYGWYKTDYGPVVYCVNLFVKAELRDDSQALAPYRVHVRFNQSGGLCQHVPYRWQNLATSIRTLEKLPKSRRFRFSIISQRSKMMKD